MIKPMDLFDWQDATRRHSLDYGNEEQRRQAEKDAVLWGDIYEARH